MADGMGDSKSQMRKRLPDALAAMSPEGRHAKSVAATAFITSSPEFAAAQVVMLYLSTTQEVDTAPLALRCWQAGKAGVVPRVSWNQRRMPPVEIQALKEGMTPAGPGILEPLAGKPVPVEFID